jgi:phosphosulfolactate phosphohydrolase-like enzyme
MKQMIKQMHVTFATVDEATHAQKYLSLYGIEDVSVSHSQIEINVSKDNWIAAHQIVNGLGGEIEQNEAFNSTVAEQYQIDNAELDTEAKADEEEISMVDKDHYIDMNLGYGDFEIIEPYVLNTYEKIEEESDDTEKF